MTRLGQASISFTFAPLLVDKPWGGQRLRGAAPDRRPASVTESTVGEAWLYVPAGSHASRIDEGEWAGLPIDTVLAQPPAVLVKLLDTADVLSLQVHRDKWESWLVLDAAADAHVYCGLRAGVGVPELRAVLSAEPARLPSLLRRVPVTAGDFLENPAGTVHAVGAGCLLLEVQTLPDETLRLFDWGRVDADGRPRPLQVEEGLRAVVTGRLPQPIPAGDKPRTCRQADFDILLPAAAAGAVLVRGHDWELSVECSQRPRARLRCARQLLTEERR